ncbi:MAG TPA: DNA/RNA non-specific endonuclease, partial [Bacteroidia bacterium]|nr:DNA/RNA non-specific endonuclease [Bacteroidia bacterium]
MITMLLIVLCQWVFAQDSSVAHQTIFKKIKTDPVLEQAQTVIVHDYYTIGYFEKYRIPLWTYYKGTKEQMLQCLLPRKGSFRRDPLINLTQAGKEDYALPFEKGHLVPCEPMTFNEEAMRQTFYYTNCAPQYEKVNSGKWRSLEKLVNNWSIDALEIMVFTGNVVSEKSKRLGANGVTVPDYCF